MNIKKWLFIGVLVSIFYINVSFLMGVEKIELATDSNDKCTVVELVSDNGSERVTVKMSRVSAYQSNLIKDMLEECDDDEDEEIPSIPVPNVRPRDLRDVKILLDYSYMVNTTNNSVEINKIRLVRYIKRKIEQEKEKVEEYGPVSKRRKVESPEENNWGNRDKLMHLLKAADYLDADLVVRALAYVLSEKQITKDDLKKFPSNIFCQILVHHILRINSCYSQEIIKIFDREIIDDLKKTKPIIEKDKNLDNIENLYNQVLEGLKNGKIFVPLYNIYEENIDQLVDYSLDKCIDGFKFPLLVSGSFDGTIKLWDVETGKEIKTLMGHANFVTSVVFSLDGKTIASGAQDGTIKLWNVKTGECIKTLEGHNHYVTSVVFSPDGKIIASGSYDCTIKLWDVKTGECIKTLEEHTDYVNSVVFSPDGKIIASGSDDCTIKLWDVKTGECIKTLEGHPDYFINSVVFSPNGNTIAFGAQDGTIKLWKIKTGECIKTLEGPTDYFVTSVVFSPDGNFIVSGFGSDSDDGTIKLWGIKTGECIKTLRGHDKPVTSVVFSPDGNTIASCSDSWKIKLWDMKSGECIKTLRGHTNFVNSVTFRPINLKEK